MKLKTETDLEPAKERGMRREVDSQVNISMYLKKPEDVLEMLLISMPALCRPTLVGHGPCRGTSAWSLCQLLQGDGDTAGHYQPNFGKQSVAVQK